MTFQWLVKLNSEVYCEVSHNYILREHVTTRRLTPIFLGGFPLISRTQLRDCPKMQSKHSSWQKNTIFSLGLLRVSACKWGDSICRGVKIWKRFCKTSSNENSNRIMRSRSREYIGWVNITN